MDDSRLREQLGKASLVVLIVALFIQPVLVHLLFIPDGIAAFIRDAFFVISIILAFFGKGLIRIMVFVLQAIIIIPFLIIVIFFGMGLNL
ncbi:MAG TPA: hypothetical protein VFT51_15515 [Bacillales bacterium]|nr:hypothetical protein [Bacillales bacterium]